MMAISSMTTVVTTIVNGNQAGIVLASCTLPVRVSVVMIVVWEMRAVMMVTIVMEQDVSLIAQRP